MFSTDTKILIIDDMLTMRKIVKKNLTELGYTNVKDANDGSTAWPLLEEDHEEGAPFQLILSDWNMPTMTGLELLKKVRSDDRFKELPFVMITAEAEKSQVVEALEVGVSNYIVKPFDAPTLKEKLEQTYKKHLA